ncbi:probable sugar phosphate/phosphate translocator At1g06470 [Actinidia eriantha]|uniref:probable sugar phosphate/phosphate translocator At1g06470 n=1 Tax=Actinidia eriantha TaxID=165200 RepID=UPI00258BF468|nr:probable sugar phosphate/phosphate translocator At1g06470 [Actinidia eriantha]XP_057506334.1 probable sugar phosphate/phosphate translocator At1g06470 [Actinidia eriantha]XP_057506335.1 probable sugar phosphate/phosphate translocator At1g06470 [Actinidia eriantha]XP_057506336.1 probable sugar phosphate/phosphate translocator At1g06470 [Actinidia eriantha]
MVESDSDTEKVKISEHNISQGGSQGSVFPREPSFSGWCDEDGAIRTDGQLETVNQSLEDFRFELPSLPQGDLGKRHLDGQRERNQQKRMQVNGGNNEDGASAHGLRNANGKRLPFDIENGSGKDNIPNSVHTDFNSMDNHGTSESKNKSLISSVDVLKTLSFILVWYIFSTSLTLYNKNLLGDDLGKFPAPLLMNTVHFGMQALLSNAITWFWSQRFKPSVSMSWKDYFLRVVPTALGTALDINLSNASLVFISVTFATMCKSASPIFLLLFAFAFRLESPSFKLSGIIFIISVGILLTVAKETEFELWGFVFVMLAAVMSGFRWTMTQILLQKEAYGLKDPITLMSYVTPVMAVATALLSLILDPWDEFTVNNYFNSSWHIIRSCLLMLFGGTLAFFMVLTEYILVSITSAVTVTIAGIVKEAVTILVAVFYFHDPFTWLKGVGLIIIMVGVSLFNLYKYQKLQKGELGDENIARSSVTKTPARYVILEDLDDQDDGP